MNPGYHLDSVQRSFLAALLAGLLALGLAGTANAFSEQDLSIPMDDGAALAATLYTPDGSAPPTGWPAAILFHGIGGTRAGMTELAAGYLAPQGYAVLTFDARGHGASGGLFSADGPREMQDVKALHAWLAARPGIDRAHIGAIGISLGGGAVWRSAIEGVPWAAIVPLITWTDLYEALIPHDLAKSGAVLQFLQAVSPARSAPALNAIREDVIQSRNAPALRAFSAERSSRPQLNTVSIPTFMLQGRRDFAFDLREALSAFSLLRGPKRLYIGNLGHAPASNPAAERPYYFGQIRLWLDRFLKGMPNGIDTRPPIELAPDPWTGKTVNYRSRPPTTTLSLSFRGRQTITPSGKVVRTVKLPRRALETFGAPTVQVTAASATGWPRLVAVLSALAPGGEEIVLSAGGTKTDGLTSRGRRITIRLISQATTIPSGSRLRLTLASSSTAQNTRNLLYLDIPFASSARLALSAATVKLPVLQKRISINRSIVPSSHPTEHTEERKGYE